MATLLRFILGGHVLIYDDLINRKAVFAWLFSLKSDCKRRQVAVHAYLRLLDIMMLNFESFHWSYHSCFTDMFRDWSLITGRGGYKTGGGGHVKFYPYEKGGRKKF